MKHLLLAIALIAGLLSTGQEVVAIAAPPVKPKTGIKQFIQFSEPKALHSPGIEQALLFLTFLSIPTGKLLYQCYCAYRTKVFRQKVDDLEKVWQIEAYSRPEQ